MAQGGGGAGKWLEAASRIPARSVLPTMQPLAALWAYCVQRLLSPTLPPGAGQCPGNVPISQMSTLRFRHMELLSTGILPSMPCFQPQNSPSCNPCPESNPFPGLRDSLFQEVFPELREPPLSGTLLHSESRLNPQTHSASILRLGLLGVEALSPLRRGLSKVRAESPQTSILMPWLGVSPRTPLPHSPKTRAP